MKKRYQQVPLKIYELDNTEVYQLVLDSKEAINGLKTSLQKETLYGRELAELDKLLPLFEQKLHANQKSQKSQQLLEADRERDNAFLTLQSLVASHRRIKTAEIKEAYQTLSELFAQYKKVTSATYEKETESINHLLARLKAEPYQALAERLHLTAHISSLVTAQKAFELAYDARLKEIEVTDLLTIRQLRTKLLDRYELLVDFTTIYRSAYPELVAYKKLNDRLNAIRSRFRPQKAGKKSLKEEQEGVVKEGGTSPQEGKPVPSPEQASTAQ